MTTRRQFIGALPATDASDGALVAACFTGTFAVVAAVSEETTSTGFALSAVAFTEDAATTTEGALAAATACDALVAAFWKTPQPFFDPLGFLHLTLGHAHQAVNRLGEAMPVEQRPRATVAVALVQGDSVYWAHVGDSRVYLLRRNRIVERTRDHSLRGKPVLVGHPGRRGVVAAASYEARKFGCHSAQPMVQAMRLCPQAIIVAPNFPAYRDMSARVHEMLREMSPVWEAAQGR